MKLFTKRPTNYLYMWNPLTKHWMLEELPLNEVFSSIIQISTVWNRMCASFTQLQTSASKCISPFINSLQKEAMIAFSERTISINLPSICINHDWSSRNPCCALPWMWCPIILFCDKHISQNKSQVVKLLMDNHR